MLVDFDQVFRLLHLAPEHVDQLTGTGIRDELAHKVAKLAGLRPCIHSCVIIESIALGFALNWILLRQGEN
jgi:hypothetical protein